MGFHSLSRQKKFPCSLALYDLKNDLGEQNDIAAKHPKIAKDMETIISELE